MNTEILLSEYCHHSTYMRNVTAQTTKRYREKIGYFFKYSQITTIDQVTEAMVHSFFLHGRVDKQWKTTTYRTYYMTLVVFFRWCVKHGHLPTNYIESMELPKLEKSLPKALRKRDAFRLLEVVYHYPYTHRFLKFRNHAIFSMFLFSGLRKNELLHLKLNDVDLENLTLFVRQGKGNKDRIIPISYTLAQNLNRYLLERKKRHKTCPEFFTCSNRNRGLSAPGLKLVTDQIKKASEIDFTIHKLRHTYATLMLEGGCDIFSLSKMMGHSDIKTTTIYLSATAEHLRSQIVKHPLNKTTF